MAICSYVPVEGPFGHGFNPTITETETPTTISYTEIGVVNGVHYIEVPEGVNIPKQAEDIQFKVVDELPPELEEYYTDIQDARELKELEQAETRLLGEIAELKSRYLQALMLGDTEETDSLAAEIKTLLGVE